MTVDNHNIAQLPAPINNETMIEDAAVRYLWAGWYIFIALASLIGDTVILTASMMHKAIKLHEVMIAFIQHIAVTDLMASVAWLLPGAVSLIANKWVFGTAICYLRTPIYNVSYQAVRLLICGMTTSKLLMLKYPLRAVSWSAGQAHKVCAGIWFLSCIICASFRGFNAKEMHMSFDFKPYICTYVDTPRVEAVMVPIINTVFGLIPSFVIVLTGGMVLRLAGRVARQARQGLRWQGVLTVVLTATVYVISFLPREIYHIASVWTGSETQSPYKFKVVYFRWSVVFVSVNVVSNFFIYCLAVDSFRDYLRDRFQRLICLNQGEI